MSRFIAVPALILAALACVPTDASACAMALPPSMRVAEIGNLFDAIDAEADVTAKAETQAEMEKRNNFVRQAVEMPAPPVVETTLSTERKAPAPKATIPEATQQIASAEVPRT